MCSLHLCLPLIRPIGSRRPPKVLVMEPIDAWHVHHPAWLGGCTTPRLGRVLVSEVCRVLLY